MIVGAFHDALVHTKSRFIRGIWQRLHHVLVPLFNPEVCVRVGARRLWMKFSHPLPFLLTRFEHYDTVLPRLGEALRRQKGGLTMIDVGANIGDTASLVLDRVEARILALEADADYFRLLVKNTAGLPTVTCLQATLTDRDDGREAGLTKVEGTAFVSKAGGMTLDTLLADQEEFAGADLLKIDTDGFDFKVLKGARQLLARRRPVLFFEFAPEHYEKIGRENPIEVFGFLQALGYAVVAFYDNEGWLMCSGHPGRDHEFFEQLVRYARIKGHYYDLVVFHADDGEFARKFLESERQHFRPAESPQLDRAPPLHDRTG